MAFCCVAAGAARGRAGCAARSHRRPKAPPAATSAGKPTPPGDAQKSICLLVESAARANDLPVEFFARVIWQESRFRADAVGPVTRSGKRALGIAQFMPGTAAERNLLNPLDPIQALPKSAEFLARAARRVRQSRSCRRGLQRRAAAHSRMDGGQRARCRRKRATMCWPSPAARSSNGPRPTGDDEFKQQPRRELRAADGAAQARAEPVRRGARTARPQRRLAAVGRDPRRRHVARPDDGPLCRASAAPCRRRWPGATRS